MSSGTRIKPGLRFHGDQLAGPGTLDFAVNVWPGGRPRRLRRALHRALLAETYPDESAAVTAIARRFRRPRAEVLPTNGAGEAFWLLAHALRPRHAACVHPSFTEPEAALRQVGAKVTRVFRRESDWSLDPTAVPDDADLVVLGNPNNPTGNVDSPGAIAPLARPGRLLVVDEAFIDFVRRRGSSLAERRDVPGLVVVRSLTKLWSLAAIRAGFLLGPAELVSTLAESRQPWSVNALACAALEACANDRTTQKRVARDVAAARAELTRRLEALPDVHVWPSEANYLLLEVTDGPATINALRAEGIVVRPAASFPGLGPNHLRVAVRLPEDNARLAAALEATLA
jgi:histidinol-phosphate/aromatic aminotransferase/cobyric acid decarboxylase-like protein